MNDDILAKIRTQYAALNTRMKRVVMSGVVAIFYFILDTAVIQPLMEEYSEVTRQIEQAKTETKLLGMEILKLKNQSGINTALSIEEQINQYKEKIYQLDQQIATTAKKFVNPEEMAQFVERLLIETKNVHLLNLNKLPAKLISVHIPDSTPVQTAGAKNAIKKAANQKTSPAVSQATGITSNEKYDLYRHSIQFTIKGRYKDLLRCLERLEALPWQINWDSAALNTKEYPDSELSIVIYTLSLDSTWLRI
ncbi:MAG: hypothetical protein OEX19_08460 [Gammaproteobacteria bacterium]|nr:hypothetical protein [Gammaproteobacteria bacterium]